MKALVADPVAVISLPKVYVASKSRLGPLWREARTEYADRITIISTWIDESGEGESSDLADLWVRCVGEAVDADAVIAVHTEGDIWKGAYIEIGAALASGRLVVVVGAPDGSWVNHPNVCRARSIAKAVELIEERFSC